MDFDPSIFGTVGQIAVFSATGDQISYANVTGQDIWSCISISLSSAGIGQLPGLPVFTVCLPVLAARAGRDYRLHHNQLGYG